MQEQEAQNLTREMAFLTHEKEASASKLSFFFVLLFTEHLSFKRERSEGNNTPLGKHTHSHTFTQTTQSAKKYVCTHSQKARV